MTFLGIDLFTTTTTTTGRQGQGKSVRGQGRASHPSLPDKACQLGYKAKQGYVVYRISRRHNHTLARSTWKKRRPNIFFLEIFATTRLAQAACFLNVV